MKRKSIVTICAIALMLVLSLSVLAACNKNKHNFSSEWKNDEQYHWHECVTKKHTDVADKAEHTFDAGVVTKDPTEAEEGVKTFTCTVCGYQKTEAVPKLGHTFDMNKWKYDDENHWHPATCGHADEKKDLGAHVWNEGVVTKEPTETEEGVKTYTCTTCGKTKTATIGKLDHKHTFDMEAWKFDDENHWHPATCGHADEKKDLAAHVWNEGVVTKEPTEAEEGVKTYTCTTCGKTKTATIGRLDHEHTFNMEAWTYDDENHWHPATCGHTDEKKGFEAHNWNAGVVTTEPNFGVEGEKTFTCTVCKATRTEPIAALAAKDNEIVLKAGKTLGKEYDGEAISITKEDFVIAGNRELAFMFKVKGAADDTYTADAPKNAGEYTVKVSVAATAEWKAASNTFDFAIAKKSLMATATKTYDGNATMPATLTGVVAGETVTATITMTSKNVGATVKEVMLAGADKDNYTLTAANVNASITPMTIGVDWWPEYNSKSVFTGEPAELLDGDEAMITVTMESANVGAAVQDVEITGKDAANYSLAIEDVNVEIVKADINGFEISNAAAFEKGFYVGATNIPEPTTDYVEIGTGYGERAIVWEKQLESGVWSRDLTKEEVMQSKTGTFRVRIKYAEGDNYNFGATQFVSFTLNVKPRTLTVKSFAGKTYDGKPFANFTFKNLVNRVGAPTHDGVQNFTSGLESGEKYVEYRKKGEVLWTKVTDTYIPKNAAEYEYRIGVTATDEWAAVVSETKSFTIAQVEIKLEKGYVTTSTILQNGDLLYLASYTPVAGETVALRLVNAKAGLELTAPGSGYVKQDQKKKLSIQYNLDCFKLTATTSNNISNYKLVKDPKQTSVEITVPPSGIGTSKLVTGTSQSSGFDPNQKLLAMWTTVNTGSFQVGQTVIVYDNTGTKLFEAKINRVGVVDPDGDGTYNITSQSGCVIPSDGKVCIQVDVTGITYDVNKVKGGNIRVK